MAAYYGAGPAFAEMIGRSIAEGHPISEGAVGVSADGTGWVDTSLHGGFSIPVLRGATHLGVVPPAGFYPALPGIGVVGHPGFSRVRPGGPKSSGRSRSGRTSPKPTTPRRRSRSGRTSPRPTTPPGRPAHKKKAPMVKQARALVYAKIGGVTHILMIQVKKTMSKGEYTFKRGYSMPPLYNIAKKHQIAVDKINVATKEKYDPIIRGIAEKVQAYFPSISTEEIIGVSAGAIASKDTTGDTSLVVIFDMRGATFSRRFLSAPDLDDTMRAVFLAENIITSRKAKASVPVLSLDGTILPDLDIDPVFRPLVDEAFTKRTKKAYLH